jgi:MFS family permease
MYVLEVTGSAAVFAGILSIAIIPTILLSPFGGILADRANRKNIMVASDTLTGFSILFAVLFLNDGGNDLIIISGLLIALSILGAFETPVVGACIPQMQTGENIIKANAVINQTASLSYLIAPILGGVFYAAFGLKPVMLASVIFFFFTALLECFIKLDYQPSTKNQNILTVIKNDFIESMKFIGKEQTGILKMLFLVAFARFFVMGTIMVGLPFIVRNILGLNAKYYGGAESILAIATIIGSVAAGLLTTKLKTRKLSFILAALGAFIIPAGFAFLLPIGSISRYIIILIAFCGVQISISIFSIFGVSIIQQRTPNHLSEKLWRIRRLLQCAFNRWGKLFTDFFLTDLVKPFTLF